MTPGGLGTAVGPAPRGASWPVAARAWVGRHPFATFVGLAYASSWSFWALAAVGGGEIPFLLGGLGPLLAAGVVPRLTGGSLHALLRPVWHQRVAPRWCA